MYINVVKKSQQLFSSLSFVLQEEKGQAKKIAEMNPLYSWHANHFVVQRKKIVVLMNDLTLSTIILYDINAKTKKDLDTLIKQGIYQLFKLNGLPKETAENYLQKAGNIEVNDTYNRSIIGCLNNLIEALKYGNDLIISDGSILLEEMEWTNEYIYSYKKYAKPRELLQQALADGLPDFQKEVSEDRASVFQLEKNWTSYKRLKELISNHDEIKQNTEELIEQFTQNNALVLESFRTYLEKIEKLSPKTIGKHLRVVDLYLNHFLFYYGISTPISEPEQVMDFLSNWYPHKVASSQAQEKQAITSMKKFYRFLFEMDELDKESYELYKENISQSAEYGEFMDEFLADFFD